MQGDSLGGTTPIFFAPIIEAAVEIEGGQYRGVSRGVEHLKPVLSNRNESSGDWNGSSFDKFLLGVDFTLIILRT